MVVTQSRLRELHCLLVKAITVKPLTFVTSWLMLVVSGSLADLWLPKPAWCKLIEVKIISFRITSRNFSVWPAKGGSNSFQLLALKSLNRTTTTPPFRAWMAMPSLARLRATSVKREVNTVGQIWNYGRKSRRVSVGRCLSLISGKKFYRIV